MKLSTEDWGYGDGCSEEFWDITLIEQDHLLDTPGGIFKEGMGV